MYKYIKDNCIIFLFAMLDNVVERLMENFLKVMLYLCQMVIINETMDEVRRMLWTKKLSFEQNGLKTCVVKTKDEKNYVCI